MALQVWLPLNGTLENKGLSNVTVTNNGATVDNNGKIGKCYHFNSNTLIFPTSFTGKSVCFWIKSSKTNSTLAFVDYSSKLGFGFLSNGHIIVSSSGFAIPMYSSTNFVANTWNHIAIIKKTSDADLYINGVKLTNRISTVNNWDNNTAGCYIGGRSTGTYMNCYINDFRIYDHALSPKEVKEISKGLILHYKLDGNDIGISRNISLIPDGVELYDYIENNGQQWLNTGLVANPNTKVECKFKSDITSPICIYGSTVDSSKGFRLFWLLGLLYAASGGNRALNTMTPSTNTIYTTIHSHRSLEINNTSYNTTSGSGFGDNITLMHDPYSPSYWFDGKFYYCKIWNGSILVRNFLPCTYLGEPGMWDTVENKFYRNQGTGLFTLGNKITLKEFEYLKGDGNAYINTGLYPGGNTSIKMKLTPLATSSARFFGAYSGSSWTTNSFGLCGNSANAIFSNYSNDMNLGTYTSIFPINTIHNVYRNKNLLYIDNVLVRLDTYSNFTAPNVLYIFNATGYAFPTKMDLYYTKIWDNDTLIRDFIPVSYNGTPGLWDKVEWKFYANAGTGDFTLGPEKTVQQDISILYDSSGYCNHGNITGTLTTNSDSPRYTASTVFSSYTNYITVNSVPKCCTISYWFKPDSISNNVIFAGNDANRFIGAMTSAKIYNANAGTSSKLYIDGELLTSSVSSSTINFNKPLLSGWHHYCFTNVDVLSWTSFKINNLHSSWPINGKLSDVRIYATALSEDDVKELYNTSAFVTNNGVFAEYELYEDNLSDVKKTGLLETANFYENGAESGYTLDTDKTRVASNYIISEDFIEI